MCGILRHGIYANFLQIRRLHPDISTFKCGPIIASMVLFSNLRHVDYKGPSIQIVKATPSLKLTLIAAKCDEAVSWRNTASLFEEAI